MAEGRQGAERRLLADQERFPNPVLLHPVVVVSGDLYEADFGREAVTVRPIPGARLHWGGRGSTPIVVDVVTLDELIGATHIGTSGL